MPQSAIAIFAAAAGIDAVSRSASQREFEMTAAAREITGTVAARMPRISVRLATSVPCAITTSGQRATSEAAAPAAPAGKRKWAKMTSGRKRRAVTIDFAARVVYLVGAPPRRLIAVTSTSLPRRSSSRVSGTRKLPRSGFSGLGHICVTSWILIGAAGSRSRSADQLADRERAIAARCSDDDLGADLGVAEGAADR